MCCKKQTTAALQHRYLYLICYHHLAKLFHSLSTNSDNNDQYLTNSINMAKNTGAAIHVTRLLKYKTKFHFKYIKVLNFEVRCVWGVGVGGGGEGGATLTSLAY